MQRITVLKFRVDDMQYELEQLHIYEELLPSSWFNLFGYQWCLQTCCFFYLIFIFSVVPCLLCFISIPKFFFISFIYSFYKCMWVHLYHYYDISCYSTLSFCCHPWRFGKKNVNIFKHLLQKHGPGNSCNKNIYWQTSLSIINTTLLTIKLHAHIDAILNKLNFQKHLQPKRIK